MHATGQFPDFMMNKVYIRQTEWSLNEKTRQKCRARA